MKITIKQAAKRMGIDPQTLREGIKRGAFPFGTAFKRSGSSTFTYYIYPALFERYINDMEK